RADTLAQVRAAEAGAEEQLQRPEHACRDDDLIGAEDLAPAGPAGPPRNDLPASAGASQEEGFALRVDLRAAFLGEPQVVAVQRVLRAVAATDHAAAAADTRVEVDGDRRATKRLGGAHPLRDPAQDVLRRRLERNLGRAEHLAHDLVVRRELFAQAGIERLVENARVDERSA